MGNEVNYNPDILSCLANLSNDEVFTPPELVNRILDMLPTELWSNPDTKVLDPCCKSGVFLREIAKRMLEGEKEAIPDLQQRIDNIFHNQLYGIAITELTSLLSRRSLYCSKFANGQYSVSLFDDVAGNIRYNNPVHTWDGNDDKAKCIYCGASREEYDRDKDSEQYAYEFIHLTSKQIKELSDMHFDLIIGNPPYQLSDGGAQASASPLYNLFIQQAKKLKPRYLTMIVPARWYAGGKGLDAFRHEMLSDKHVKELHDFPHTEDCFPGVNIRGGVCYFLWDRDYDNTKNLTKVVNHDKGTQKEMQRPLKYRNLDIFIRYGDSIPILDKVIDQSDSFLIEHVSPRKPFGLSTDFAKTDSYHKTKQGLHRPIECYGKGLTIGYVEEESIPINRSWIYAWKVMTSRANNIGTELNDDNLNAFICRPGQACTESYLLIGMDLNLDEIQCCNLCSYLETRFTRFLHSLAKSSQDATSKTYRFVPMQDFSKPWTDKELYKKYGLSEDEIAFIELMIKPMNNDEQEA